MSHIDEVTLTGEDELNVINDDGSGRYYYICKGNGDTGSLPADDMLDFMSDWPHPFVVQVISDQLSNQVVSVVYGGDRKTTYASCVNYLASIAGSTNDLKEFEDTIDVGGGEDDPIGLGG